MLVALPSALRRGSRPRPVTTTPMKSTSPRLFRPKLWTGSLLVLALAALAPLPTARAAVTWKNVQLGGFASQGFLVNSGHNDYLGDTSDGTFDFREYGLNASWSRGKFRVGAQAFGQKLGEYGDDQIKLDWAIVDYQATQWFGLRAGRVKMPRGLYNEALDIDSVRPFVLLPQSVYDARLRDFNAAFNGAMIYGNVGLKSLGSLDYRLFYGEIPMSVDSGANDYFNNDAPYPNSRIDMDAVYGGSVFWNPPLAGLRLGYSYSAFDNFFADRLVYLPASDLWPEMTLIMYKAADLYERHLLSAEYTTGDWVFAAEVGKEKTRYDIGMYEFGTSGAYRFESVYGYLSAARRINSRLELGTYYSYSIDQQDGVMGQSIAIPDLIQDDLAVSARFDVSERLVLKVEGHLMKGAGKLFDTPTKPQPVPLRDDSWFLLAVKATYSF